ncbi:hypothetical protein ACMXYO_09470 [Neptuniibacter sp. QD37_6]|uniref:hypothetical protein n=1 Tax=Neptuniibacter sp. QD37_6 TaxID=3398210 RepID=UPI0039F5BD4D
MHAAKPPAVTFNGDEYAYRATESSAHQYTPTDQADLSSYKDMISFTFSEEVKTKSDLKPFAEKFLAAYNGKGKIIKAIAGPDPRDPSLFLLATMTTSDKSSEANMFLIRVENEAGVVMNYSHHIYGKDQSKAVMDWFNANGHKMESTLMSFKEW